MKKLTGVVIGYGLRGAAYAEYAVNCPDEIEIVAVADAIENRRKDAQKKHNLPDDKIFSDWKEIADLPKMADFAIIATQDNMHYEPALAMIEKGYNLLLEKPMAPTPKECKDIAEAAEKKGVKVIVCHVLRFTNFWYKIKDIIDDGEIGEIMSVIHMENVGNLHQSHSYVRGNWRNTDIAAPMLLAKSCHDMDILQWLIGKECKKVQSFGSLSHFTPANRPEGAPEYCIQGCPVGDKCCYNAMTNYYEKKDTDWADWFRSAATNKVSPTDEDVLEAMKNSSYGKCVYASDNNVVDHQVVNLEFEGGCTVTFSMNAFNKGGRFIRIFGTKGELIAGMDENVIEIFDFATRETKKYELSKIGQHITSGHGGGDTGIMRDLYKHFNDEMPSKSICSVRTSYMNHIIGFAAEKSRNNGIVVDVQKYADEI